MPFALESPVAHRHPLPNRDRKYLQRRILAVSGRIFLATSVPPNVDRPSERIFVRSNFWPNHRSLTLAVRKERYRAATVRESVPVLVPAMPGQGVGAFCNFSQLLREPVSEHVL